MSLLGNLADLSLGDIFQIVSLSRRSGTLQLTTPEESGEIVFDGGRVVAAYITGSRQSIGESLLDIGAVPPTTYQDMLVAQSSGTQGRAVLTQFDLDPMVISDALEEILKRTVYEMFDWDEGTFSFVLEDEPNPWRGFSLTGTRIVAQRGLNPQYLAIEGARLRDERTQGDALESFLARDKGRGAPSGRLSRAADVETFAAQLREAPKAQPSDSEKVIPFPGAQPRVLVSEPPAAIESLAAIESPAAVESPTETESTVHVDAGAARVGPSVAALGQNETAVAVATHAAPSSWCLLAVDDDPQVTRHIHAAFGNRFAAVVTANTISDALGEIDSGPPSLVVASDLIIARSDGAGILGGIEILERVRQRSTDLPVVLFTDYENVEAKNKADKLGVSGFLMKPRKAQIQAVKQKDAISPPMQQFLDTLAEVLGPYLDPDVPSPVERRAPADAPEAVASERLANVSSPPVPRPIAPEVVTPEASIPYDLRREIADYMVDVEVPGSEELPSTAPAAGPVSTLRSMLAELVDPANRDTVTLLVLRFASLVFERAVLFLVTRRSYVGLGGFSVEESSDRFVVRVRKIQIPVDSGSVFERVSKYRAPYRGPLERNPGNERLISAMGGGWPEGDVVAMPLVSNDRVAAVLYGDNPSGDDVGATDTLEIFLQQAGLAMDRVLLERKLEEARRQREPVDD